MEGRDGCEGRRGVSGGREGGRKGGWDGKERGEGRGGEEEGGPGGLSCIVWIYTVVFP